MEEFKTLDEMKKNEQPQNNFKCGKCNHKFFMKDDKIMCPECGYRILYKLRTKNPITLKTE